MMDFENIWKQSGGNDEDLNKLFQQNNLSKLHSRLPLKKLKKNLLTGMLWSVLITAIYISIFFYIHYWQVYLALTILIVFNLWIFYESWKLYKQTPSYIIPSNSLIDELTNNYNSFNHWWSLQLKVSVFVYPIATAGGFIIGGILGSGKSVESFLYNFRVLGIMVVTILILMPISYYIANWAFKQAYGKHLIKLKLLIDELSSNDS